MIIDTSAIFAILAEEAESEELIVIVGADANVMVSTVTVLEAGMVIEARLGPNGAANLDLWFVASQAKIEPFDARQAAIARRAWRKFGKGNHPAALDFGDCCVYALAKAMDEPILCKGSDFSRTDIAVIQVRRD